MIYDCFMYMNEKEVLDIRLNELNNIVDHFVAVEATTTHSGKPKPLHLQEMMEENDPIIAPFRDKITVVKALIPVKEDAWIPENYQREQIIHGLENLKDNDILLISDVDEIPSAGALDLLLNSSEGIGKNEHIVFKQWFFYYNFMLMKKDLCHGTALIRGRDLRKHGTKWFRDQRFTAPSYPNSGWHCSFFGGEDQISNKIKSFAHTEWNKDEFSNIDNIKLRVESGEDIFGRIGQLDELIPVPDHIPLPKHVTDNPRKYAHLLCS